MTRYIPIGDVELRLDMIARALGIPAATLDKLASGEWVAVPRDVADAMDAVCEGALEASVRRRRPKDMNARLDRWLALEQRDGGRQP